MKRLFVALAATLAMTSVALAQSHFDKSNSGIPGVAQIYIYDSAGPDQMALSVTTNTPLSVPIGATIAQICVEGGSVRYRDAGSAATSTLGIPANPGCFTYAGPLASLSFTAVSGTPTLDVSYYRAH
jgi:hypothetical protein